MVELYAHQKKMVEDIRQAFGRYRKVLALAPCGGGKTVIACDIIKKTISRGRVAWFVVHRVELLDQTVKTLKNFGIDCGVIASGYASEPSKNVHVCLVNSIKRRAEMHANPDLIIFDECHHVPAKTWADVFETYGAYKLGFTATPWRSGKQQLGDFFDVCIKTISTEELIAGCFLSDYKMFCPTQPDLSAVNLIGSDFNPAQLSDAMETSKIFGDCIKSYKKHALGKKTIAYEINIKRALELAQSFRDAGIRAVSVDGKTDKETRRAACIDFADGNIDVLVNVDLFTEGFDLSAQAGREVTIEAGIFNRPTCSIALWLQQVMRPMRKKPYPAILLDHAGNTNRLKILPDSDITWDIKSSGPAKILVTPTKNCADCFMIYKSNLRKCPFCGCEIIKPEYSNEKTYVIDQDLIEIQRIQKKQEEKKCTNYRQLLELAKARGYSDGWAWRQARMRNML